MFICIDRREYSLTLLIKFQELLIRRIHSPDSFAGLTRCVIVLCAVVTSGTGIKGIPRCSISGRNIGHPEGMSVSIKFNTLRITAAAITNKGADSFLCTVGFL